MEIWDLYDENRRNTGRIHVRGEKIPEGFYHMVVRICLFSRDGKLLIQRRHPEKIGWPGLWDITAAGSAVAGETSAQAAMRELQEEVGIGMDIGHECCQFSRYYSDWFDDWYVVFGDPAPETLVLQPEEVVDARWAGQEEVLAMLADGRFVPYESPWLEMLFLLGKTPGKIRKW